ncbi:unnamed protein product, partial [Allacma fusca]
MSASTSRNKGSSASIMPHQTSSTSSTTAPGLSTRGGLKRQKSHGGYAGRGGGGSSSAAAAAVVINAAAATAVMTTGAGAPGPFRGPSTDSQQSRVSLQVPPAPGGSLAGTPLLPPKTYRGRVTGVNNNNSNGPHTSSNIMGHGGPPTVAVPLVHQYSDTTTGGTRSDNNVVTGPGGTGTKRETFKWSGVIVSFDADSVKIENEVNGAPPGIKTIGKE